MAMKQSIRRCNIFVVVVVVAGFSLLVCLFVCLFPFLANASQRRNVGYAKA